MPIVNLPPDGVEIARKDWELRLLKMEVLKEFADIYPTFESRWGKVSFETTVAIYKIAYERVIERKKDKEKSEGREE